MAARIIKIAGLVVLAAALSAPLASAMRSTGDDGGSVSSTSTYLNTPAQDQGMQGTAVVAPNDKGGTQGIGQTSDPVGIGGQYGANLIKNAQASKKRDLQAATTFKLPLAPDDRPGTSTGATQALVIPYVSHGFGVNAAQFNGSSVRPDDRAGARPSVPTSFAAPVSTTGDGFNWGSAGIGAAGLASIALAIGLLVVLGRRSRHEDVAVS